MGQSGLPSHGDRAWLSRYPERILMRSGGRGGWVLVAALLAAACSSGDSGAGTTTLPVRPVFAEGPPPAPGTCITIHDLRELIGKVFTPNSADWVSARARLQTMQDRFDAGNMGSLKENALKLVQFVLDEFKKGAAQGTDVQVATLQNYVLCYAGLSATITDPDNTWVVAPSTAPQVLKIESGLAATQLPANAVSEPTVISITQLPNPTVSGTGPLDTKLDVYPYYFEITRSSANNTPLTQPVVVAVCPGPNTPDDVLPRLRLGHQASTGFEVTPPADASFLQCPVTTGLSRLPKWLQTVASLVLPKPLYARVRAGGGVGGTAGEFSPFAPVDPNVTLSGGVGGTAGEFLRGAMMMATSCSPIGAPLGNPVDPACRPGVKLQTPRGTLLQNVPVNFAVEPGGGTIAPEQGGTCSTFGTSITTFTGILGKAGICWTLGSTPGTYSVLATPQIGGDVPPGVTFVPATLSFSAVANSPAVVFDQQPPSGSGVIAAANIPVTVNIVDGAGTPIQGYSGTVTLTINQNSFASGATLVTATATDGVATFTGLAINTTANGYVLTASATLFGSTATTVGNSFNVVSPLSTTKPNGP